MTNGDWDRRKSVNDDNGWDSVQRFAAYAMVVVGTILAIYAGIEYIRALSHGEATLPPAVTSGFIQLVLIAFTAAGVALSNRNMAKRTDRNYNATRERVGAMETRLQNGLGSAIGDQVAPKVADELERRTAEALVRVGLEEAAQKRLIDLLKADPTTPLGAPMTPEQLQEQLTKNTASTDKNSDVIKKDTESRMHNHAR